MRLLKSLTEGMKGIDDIDELNALIKRDCKKYLKLIKPGFPQYRGMYLRRSTGIKDVRKDREPKGMSMYTANRFNDWLADNGHRRRDKSVMCTSDKKWGSSFGTSNWIFPIGNFSYTWIETRDVNIEGSTMNGGKWTPYVVKVFLRAYDDKTLDIMGRKSFEEGRHNTLLRLNKPFEEHFHTNKGFDVAVKNEFEMWIECDKYYFVDSRLHSFNTVRQEVDG